MLKKPVFPHFLRISFPQTSLGYPLSFCFKETEGKFFTSMVIQEGYVSFSTFFGDKFYTFPIRSLYHT